MHVFYTPEIKSISYTLTEKESKHAIKVLRMEEGSKVCLIDGKGGLYYGIIENPDIKNCTVKVVEKIEQYNRRNYNIHLAIAPTKNIDRYEWFLEKATEIGIDEITPILTQRSERKRINPERLEKIIVSAIKQSVKAYKPKLNKLTKFNEFIKLCEEETKLIAHCETNPKPSLKTKINDKNNFVVLIGPEGDFSPEEIKNAQQNGFQEVHLGKSRLRTETAGVVACHTINIIKDE